MDKKKIFWAIFSAVIAGLSVWAVIAQSSQFSVESFRQFVHEADKGWICGALLCMFGFIWFEGMAIRRIAGTLGHRRSVHRGTVYGAADVYFSAITPSASGGQPASAFFMMKDGIPGTVTTVTLLANLVMYTLAILILGAICLIFRFDIVRKMAVASHVLIAAGSFVLFLFGLTFYLLLRKANVMYFIGDKCFLLLEKLHLMKHGQKRRDKLHKTMDEYKECSREIHGKKAMLLEALFWNIMQRVSQFGVAFCVFMARGEGIHKSLDVFVTQCFVALGSNCAPIPGAMGVADYLMLDGYGQIVGEEMATNMELLCRAMSFYGCVLVSAIIVAVSFVNQKLKSRRVK